jgi:GNAT superfamily N-acetyltransferase
VIAIRRAIHSDLPAINAVVQASSAYDGMYRAILDGYEVTAAQLERDHLFVAEMAAQIVGFYSLVTAATEPELDLLFVADAAQGRGVGSALFNHLKEAASSLDIDVIKIVCHPPALGFYLSVGARQEGFVAPRGRVSWERPLLRYRVNA